MEYNLSPIPLSLSLWLHAIHLKTTIPCLRNPPAGPKESNPSLWFQQPIIGPANLKQGINLFTQDETIAKISLVFPSPTLLTADTRYVCRISQ